MALLAWSDDRVFVGALTYGVLTLVLNRGNAREHANNAWCQTLRPSDLHDCDFSELFNRQFIDVVIEL